ncbi:MAG: DUF1318 domain-containing protein [Pseudomonadota bacterium]
MKNTLFNFSILLALMTVSACVTVNVYFPESAAQRAADIFIRDVYGDDANAAPPNGTDAAAPPQSYQLDQNWFYQSLAFMGDILIPPAAAQSPDINIQTPAINSLKNSMAGRHQKLKSGYANGAVGMASNGLLVLRDPKAVPLQQRNQIKQLIVQENKERNKLYGEVAKANGHPEWEKEIRAIFAQRWVGNAPAGWWFETGGAWKQK